jgi:hypothetical protein
MQVCRHTVITLVQQLGTTNLKHHSDHSFGCTFAAAAAAALPTGGCRAGSWMWWVTLGNGRQLDVVGDLRQRQAAGCGG